MLRDILEKDIGRKVVWNDIFGAYAVNLDAKETEKILKGFSNKYFDVSRHDSGSRVFLNFSPNQKGLEYGLKLALQEKFDFGKEKIQVEFVSANPTGPLTLGNGRGGVYGDVLANVLKFVGNDVAKEYYVNDTGNQIKILGHSVLKDDKAEYSGDYIDELAKKVEGDNPLVVGEKSAEIILEGIKKTVANMGISFDQWFSENNDLRKRGKVEDIINWLKKKDLTFEKDGALWFKAVEFGDDEDRVIIKQDGEPTYFGVDCAYHQNKFVERKFDRVINVWGADHHGDVARVQGFVDALGYKDKLEIILMQFVRLVKDGKATRMSKREGNFVLVDDVLKEVGKDAFRYFMLTRSTDTHMDFDMELAKEQSKKNPVYYVQYAGARMNSILSKSNSPNQEFFDKFAFGEVFRQSSKNSDSARNLLLKLIQFPEIIQDISKDYQVHHLTTYIYELAQIFTNFYENVPVLNAESEELTKQRLSLVFATRQILEKGLSLLGISAPKQM
ncbi:arginine--tRNA ligase [Patescibacteria group bacterium]